MNLKVILVVGTRPEAIKMAPVWYELKRAGAEVKLCATYQHVELLNEVFSVFDMKPDFSLSVMKAGQDIFHITQEILSHIRLIFEQEKPDIVLVQGDTTTAFAAALAAYYLKIPVGHVEAGLRTYDAYAPYPEEFNRQAIGIVSALHFAPTQPAVNALQRAGVDPGSIFCTGNTIVDALFLMKRRIELGFVTPSTMIRNIFIASDQQRQKRVLFTMHRRESFGGGIERVLRAIKQFAGEHPGVFFLYPAHPNPQVQQAIAAAELGRCENIHICSPLAYQDLVYAMLNVDVVVTDSGGLQEEAVSLGKPVLVTREKTERAEGVTAGFAWLVGTDGDMVCRYLEQQLWHPMVSKQCTIYGDGTAAQQIVNILERWVDHEKSMYRRTGVYRAPNSNYRS